MFIQFRALRLCQFHPFLSGNDNAAAASLVEIQLAPRTTMMVQGTLGTDGVVRSFHRALLTHVTFPGTFQRFVFAVLFLPGNFVAAAMAQTGMGDGRDLIRLFGLGVVFEFELIVVLGQPAIFAISFLAHVDEHVILVSRKS